MEIMIEAVDVKKYFSSGKGIFPFAKDNVKAVDGVSFSVRKGSTFGLVGESGCGKSTIAKLTCGILRPDSGKIIARGEKDIVFQDPYSSLNPRMTVRQITGESLLVRGINKTDREKMVRHILERVRLKSPGCEDKYPHQFSGGERQRIAIARALVRNPAILVLDEPVSSLDVSIQAEILNLLKDLQEDFRLTYLFISHDLRVIEFMSDLVGVMRNGKLVEISSREDIYKNPGNEYTRHLLGSIPKL
ncbi:MAG: ATP-binding cassette domain-containing protein [Candidatus Omnitrophota bacterium]